MTTKPPEALRLADKYENEVEEFLRDHRFVQDEWCRQATLELRRLHAANIYCMDWYESASQEIVNLRARVQELEGQLEAIDAATEMVPVGWAISYDGKTPYALWAEGDGALLDLEVKRQGGTACKMGLYARVEKK